MSTIKYFANRVRETSTSTSTNSFVLSGAVAGYKNIISTIGENKKFPYYIYRDTVFEWEIGIGYIINNSGTILLYRDRVVSSSNNNNLVSFTSGTKYVETIVSEDMINTSLLNVSEQSGNFIADYIPSTYVIDASSSNIQVSLPAVASQEDPVILSFVLNKTIGSQYSQPNAIVLLPSGTETINGASSYDLSIKNDYLQIMSLPSQSGWVLLDPIQDSTNPYGNDGSIQVKYDNAFSGVVGLNWNFASSAFLVGGTGNAVTADIILPSGANSTVVFNEQSLANDLRIEGSGSTHLLFVDGSENKIAINSTNATDSLIINAQYGDGITIYRTGVGPQLTIGNRSASGITTNSIIGSIVFSGLNSVNNPVDYANVYAHIDNNIDTDESASIKMQIIKNGSQETVAELGSSGVSLGFDNSNIDGVVIGELSQNDGNNVVIGYYQNVCGTNCVSLGHSGVIASGTFGGLIGLNHSASGNNIWIVGGSGVSATGTNRTYLAIDNNNYITLDKAGTLDYTIFNSGNQSININNTYTLSSGIDQNINFRFTNSSGIVKTGLILGSHITDHTNLSEDTELVAKILGGGSQTTIMKISNNSINIGGDNSISGTNLVISTTSTVSGISNSIFGSGISNSGNNNIIFGNNITHSGNNTVIFGKNITCSTSGNIGITILGNNNIADEDYVSVFGNGNSASGLNAVAVGYLNGVHGEYSVGVGESNLILMDGSVAVGNNNNLDALSVDATAYSVGIGNTVNISGTGLIVGYNNEIYGSGATIIGMNSYSSGNNNFILGQDVAITGVNNIVIGNNRSVTGTGIIDIFANTTNGIQITSSGLSLYSDSSFVFDDNIIVQKTGIFSSGIISSGNINCSGTGNFVAISTNDLSLPSLVAVSGSGNVQSILYQNDKIKYNNLATSGVLATPLQLTGSDSEYQFLYPTGTSYVYLPNGTGLFMGKKFTIVNMNNTTHTIYVRRSGELSDLYIISPTYNASLVHAGNNNWVRISYHTSGTSNIQN